MNRNRVIASSWASRETLAHAAIAALAFADHAAIGALSVWRERQRTIEPDRGLDGACGEVAFVAGL